ncbi:MAG: hypothetical protein JWM74_644 [Myxococcaceae bacterium]|nr:hypothetical protein [Myxococcaceae bacterium]
MPNDPASHVTRFCLALEEFRRTPEGRVRGSEDLVQHFFPYDGDHATDRLFRHMPKDVRGPILAGWKIRGAKAALADNDEKVESVVHDALVAGDLGHEAFEQGVSAETLVNYAPHADWWQFWRDGALSERALLKALSTAYDLGLFDAKWFFDHIESGGKKGTDVLADGLSKGDLTEWMRKIHEGADGSPKGILAALGWEKIVRQTRAPILVATLDLFALEVGLHKPLRPSDAPASALGGSLSARIPPIDDVESTVVTNWNAMNGLPPTAANLSPAIPPLAATPLPASMPPLPFEKSAATTPPEPASPTPKRR